MSNTIETPVASEKFDGVSRDSTRPARSSKRRQSGSPRQAAAPVAQPRSGKPPRERKVKAPRRRRVDPTTFDKAYTHDEVEFMNAVQRFKVGTGRPYPTVGEILEIAFQLGYRKAGEPGSEPTQES